MTSPIYDLVLGNIPGARVAHEPDPDWEYPDWPTKANAPRQAPSPRGRSSRVSAVPPTKSRDLSSPSHFSKRYQQCGAKIGIVEKDAGGLAKMGKSKLSTRSTTQTLVGSAARLTNVFSVKDDNKTTNEIVMVRGGQRRQPQKRQSCKYGRKCFRRNAQHLKHFSHPMVTYYGAASGDEDENRDEEEFKERDEGRNFANSSDHVNHRVNDSPALRRTTKSTKPPQNESDSEDNGKWDHYDKAVCPFGTACFNRNGHQLRNFNHLRATSKKEENHIPPWRQKEQRDFIVYRSDTARPTHREDAHATRARVF
ncbi:hypothetical protein MTO96_030955 [Rhipicephalus appendiculatus]